MRIGVIGTGRIGTIHANTLSRNREVGSLILTDVDPALFDTGATPSDATLKAALDNGKFAAVRNEQFWGYYKNGETVALPVCSTTTRCTSSCARVTAESRASAAATAPRPSRTCATAT